MADLTKKVEALNVLTARQVKMKQLDLFVADLTDCAPKDDRHSMEHPFFSLSTKPDREIREYEHNGVVITVIPSGLGRATIWDKDILIWCASQVMQKLNNKEPVSRKLKATVSDILKTTGRDMGGRDYALLENAIVRLMGTVIKTNIATNRKREREGFSLIDGWRIIESNPNDKRMVSVEITLSEWYFNALVGREVLTLDSDYFFIRSGLAKRLYEIARKHCGTKQEWKVNEELLLKKTGSLSSPKRFRETLRKIAKEQPLPGYLIDLRDGFIWFNQRPD